jgi:hypothetical protein
LSEAFERLVEIGLAAHAVVARIVPTDHFAGIEQAFGVRLPLEGEVRAVDLFHAAFLERECVRVEDRAAVFFVKFDDLIQAILAPETHDRQSETGDLAIKTHEFGMNHDFFAKFAMHSLDQLNVCGRRVQHLQIGDPRVDAQGMQRRMIPGQLEDRQRLASGVGGGALEEDGARPRLQEVAEVLHPRLGDHEQNHARPVRDTAP